jgi:hypothetical protein
MSYGTTFDDFELEGDLEYKEVPPVWTVDLKNEKKLLEWLNKDFDNKVKKAEPRIRVYREQLALYKGVHYRSQETRNQDFRRDSGDRSIRNPKVVVNHVYDMVENKTAKMSRFRPNVAVLPQNHDEYDDKVQSKTYKMLLDSRWQEVDIDSYLRETQRSTYVFGESFLKVYWDKEQGDVDPDFLDLADSEGSAKIKTDTGEEVEISYPTTIGDVSYKVLAPDRFFPELGKLEWQEVDHGTEIDYINKEVAKAINPEKQEFIREQPHYLYDIDAVKEVRNSSDIIVKTFWHRPSKFLPKGLKVTFVAEAILKMEDYPYDHGRLPFRRLTDIDVPTELYARSFISQVRQLQRHYNNLASGVARNHGLASAPKWVMPAGACKISALNNEVTVVEYKGGVPPRLENMNPTHPEVFNYMEKLEVNIQKLAGVHGISRGTPPPGIRAGVALQFLMEQEQERENNGVAKRNALIKEVARDTIDLMKQYYKPEDGRMIRILGKDNSYMVKSFEKSNKNLKYDVRIQNASSLPESKAARIQSIIDLNMGFPGLFNNKQVIEMLDLGTDEAFKDKATTAIKAAESENESMLSGDPVEEPKPWEDLLAHYDVHLQKLQERTFKEEVPSEYQEELVKHLAITEMHMWNKATKNAAFRMKLMQNEYFPLFFTLPEDAAQLFATGGAPMPPDAPAGAPGEGAPVEDLATPVEKQV